MAISIKNLERLGDYLEKFLKEQSPITGNDIVLLGIGILKILTEPLLDNAREEAIHLIMKGMTLPDKNLIIDEEGNETWQ